MAAWRRPVRWGRRARRSWPVCFALRCRARASSRVREFFHERSRRPLAGRRGVVMTDVLHATNALRPARRRRRHANARPPPSYSSWLGMCRHAEGCSQHGVEIAPRHTIADLSFFFPTHGALTYYNAALPSRLGCGVPADHQARFEVLLLVLLLVLVLVLAGAWLRRQ
jgi:hypothetical protein